jgi:predicted transposase/invertase (TIGR01784 family)
MTVDNLRQEQKINKPVDDFIMLPKNDYAFKLIFGDEKNKEILVSLLSAILKIQMQKLKGITIINSELFKEYKEDKKGILDIRARTDEGKQIDIEIQLLQTECMTERTLFYWSKLYIDQIKSGDKYSALKKCIVINIFDFNVLPDNKLHSCFHLREDDSGQLLTDLMEIHYLELIKLQDEDSDDLLVLWMKFLKVKTKGELKMLAEKNKDIAKAAKILEVISKDEKKRMEYEAREAALRDELSRLDSAEKKGIKAEKKTVVIKALKNGINIDLISKITDLKESEIEAIRQELKIK